MRRKSMFYLCLVLGSISLAIQVIIITMLFYQESPPDIFLMEDALLVSNITLELECPAFILDHDILTNLLPELVKDKSQCQKCFTTKSRVIFGLQYSCIKKLDSLLIKFEDHEFTYSIFRSPKILHIPPVKTTLPIAVAVKRKASIVLMFLHDREDNFWWHGAVVNDPRANAKLSAVGLSLDQVKNMHSEGAIKKTEFQSVMLAGGIFTIPNDMAVFLNMTTMSYKHFIECDYRRADNFFRAYGRDTTKGGERFRHTAWKLLSQVKLILDTLNVPFWLSSGTCLGFYRQCDFIPYSQDVDIGIFAKDYHEHMIKKFISHGFSLKHTFGRKNDSLELSFVNYGIKLDIFFFYVDEVKKVIWNGGTQAKSGKKYRYNFPQFSLCWTEFLELLVRVPCETSLYIEANYGPDWFTPKNEWDWKSSPPNVVENGIWAKHEMDYVIEVNIPKQ